MGASRPWGLWGHVTHGSFPGTPWVFLLGNPLPAPLGVSPCGKALCFSLWDISNREWGVFQHFLSQLPLLEHSQVLNTNMAQAKVGQCPQGSMTSVPRDWWPMSPGIDDRQTMLAALLKSHLHRCRK